MIEEAKENKREVRVSPAKKNLHDTTIPPIQPIEYYACFKPLDCEEEIYELRVHIMADWVL